MVANEPDNQNNMQVHVSTIHSNHSLQSVFHSTDQ